MKDSNSNNLDLYNGFPLWAENGDLSRYGNKGLNYKCLKS